MFRKSIPFRVLAFFALSWVAGAAPAWGAAAKMFQGHVPTMVSQLAPLGNVPTNQVLHLSFSLPLRNEPQLDALLQQIYDPASTNFHQYLTPAEFTARFGPTESDYQSLLNFIRAKGFQVVGTHRNRLLADVTGTVRTAERAFGVNLRTYHSVRQKRDFYAPDRTPSLDAPVMIQNVYGLNNFAVPRPRSVIQPAALAAARAAAPRNGSAGDGSYLGGDFRAAYVPGTTLTGAGQSVALLQFDGYYPSDIAAYLAAAGYPSTLVNTLVNVPVNGGVATPGKGNSEVCLDIEMIMAMAPGISKIYVYEAPSSTSWPAILSKIANDNLARQVSCSWGNNTPDVPDPTSEAIFKQMAAQGMSFFNASGDSDAFVGGVPFPSESTNIIQVGGTTLSTTGPGGAWAGETAWNWGGGQGTSGGVSANFGIPAWQQGISMTASHGSTTMRNVPDVALTGDNVFVAYGNGTTGHFGGTSCAAPLWAAFTALVNQQAAQAAAPPVGFLNPALYAIGKSANYNNCFHDTATGNNYWSSSPANFPAVTGYDLCTGWGTPNGTNLINALAPLNYAPAIIAGNWSLLAESAVPANGAIDPGETVTVSFSLQNQGNLATGNLVVTLLPSANVLAPSGPQSYGALAALGGAGSQPFTFTAAGTCGSNFVATLQLQDGTNNLGAVNFALRLGQVSGLTENFDAATIPSLPTGWASVNANGGAASWVTTSAVADSAPNSAFISESDSAGENALTTPAIFISSASAKLSFRHDYSLEYGGSGANRAYYDGGVLEIQIGNGAFADITAAGGSFVSGGYNGVITTTSDNPLGGRSAWVGGPSNWQTVKVNLPASAAGQNIRLRWNCATDDGNAGGGSPIGWYVDSVVVSNAPPDCLAVFTDLAVSQTLATNSFVAGQNLIYTLAVTNLGPQTAANLVVTDIYPVNAKFSSASAGGQFTPGQAVFAVNLLPAGTATNFTLTLVPISGSAFTNLVSVVTVTPEVTTANNSAVLVAAQTNSIPPMIGNIAINPNGSILLDLTGTPGVAYVLESATNLVPPDWQPVETNTLGTNGLWQFTDPQSADLPQRFFRLKLAP